MNIMHSFYFLFFDNRDSDVGNEEMVESVKAEKKRKQMEAVAEDLFNNEKVRNARYSS
jgi:nijmegen breakage syndrome protein 1